MLRTNEASSSIVVTLGLHTAVIEAVNRYGQMIYAASLQSDFIQSTLGIVILIHDAA